MSVAAAGGKVYAGASDAAILYSITGPGRATVLYDFGRTEVRGIAVDREGAVYAIANQLEGGGRGGKLNAGRYVQLLAAAYSAVKSVDPAAVVVSGALTPTGVNDGDIAIDDRAYLEQMYQAGLARYCDAVGAHPSGYNNPPDAEWQSYSDPATPNCKGHPSWFFRGTMEGYRNIMVKYGDGHKRIDDFRGSVAGRSILHLGDANQTAPQGVRNRRCVGTKREKRGGRGQRASRQPLLVLTRPGGRNPAGTRDPFRRPSQQFRAPPPRGVMGRARRAPRPQLPHRPLRGAGGLCRAGQRRPVAGRPGEPPVRGVERRGGGGHRAAPRCGGRPARRTRRPAAGGSTAP